MSVTDDAFLGGALNILQPRSGYRAGVDAVLLAAFVPHVAGHAGRILDVGAGVGTAGLCVAARCADASVVLAERERTLVEVAEENIRRNNLEKRVTTACVEVGATAAGELDRLGLIAEGFDHVIANPPYHTEGAGTPAADALKAGSHAMPEDALELWARFAARMARPGGTATFIHKVEALPELLDAMRSRFGMLKIVPVHPRQAEPAIRVLVQGTKGSRAPLALLPAAVLHDAGNGFTPWAARVLRLGEGVDLAYWKGGETGQSKS